ELEDDLRGERDLAEALEEEEPLALDREARDRALAEVDDRHRVDLPLLAAADPRADVLAQEVVGDREEEGAKRRLLAEAIARLDAGEEGPLDQVLDPVIDLVGEEAADAVEVALEEGAAGAAIAGAPGREELGVALLHRSTLSCLRDRSA